MLRTVVRSRCITLRANSLLRWCHVYRQFGFVCVQIVPWIKRWTSKGALNGQTELGTFVLIQKLHVRMAHKRAPSEGEPPHKRVSRQQEDAEQENNVRPNYHHSQQSTAEEGEAGIVESITLKNFMCHTLLGPFTFGSNVNFVVGNNGSGKSAVLTALIVALGGTAQATNRGASLKGFVKEGESSAEVSVTLRNTGRDAYKLEDYGQAVIIDLKLTRDGMRTFKLKSKSGQIVSTKKEDLMSILDNFNIQVNNPVSILTQEMSKHFLHSKSEGDKYKFFMKATQLEQMKLDFISIKTAKQYTEEKVSQNGECLRDLKKTYLEKEDNYKSLSSLDDMQAKLEELQKQMAWCLVAEMEAELLPVRQKLKSDQLSTQKFDDKVEEWKNKVTEGERKYKQIHDQLNGLTERVQELQPQSTQLKAVAQRQDSLLKAGEVTFHLCKKSLKILESDRGQLCSRIKELKLSISQATGAESQLKDRRMQELQAELQDLSHQDSTLGQQIEQYQQATHRAKEELGKLRNEQSGLQKSIDANSRNLLTLKASSSNRLRRFGEHMPGLLKAIQDAHRAGQLKERPRGPLGYCISLKDPQMALAVEVCLKGQLQAFACDNHKDENVLQGLMARVFPSGQRPGIITSRFLDRVHDTSRRGVDHPTYPSVLQSLEVEDPVVANCLIDQRGIERILLIKNAAEARAVMAKPPRNCTQAFSVEGDQIFENRSWSAEQSRPNFLFGDVEEEIRHLQREMENQTAQVGCYQQRKQKVEEDIGKNEDLLKKAHVEQKKTQGKERKLQLELTELQNMEELQSEDLQPLEEDLEEVVGKIASQQAQCEEARAQMAQLKANFEEAEQQDRKLKDQISAMAEEADSMKEDLTNSDQEVMKCKHHSKHYEEKRKTHLDNILALQASLEGQEYELAASVTKATEICPERLEVRRTARNLDNEINLVKTKITTQQAQQGNREEIVKQYKEAYEKYKDTAQQMKCLKSFIRTLNQIITDRLKAYNSLRSMLSARCKYYFDSLLFQRGYTGSMTFNHNDETLFISVQPGEGDKAELSDMRSLSGGERSFSTVCFVLSLWAITEAPFRCLDEFDVYMDMVNRRISMDMMLKIADSQRYRQFVFLTPQSMSSLPESKFIRILRMKDPERGSQDQASSREDPA
ncbi:structural maintenance of chromosomes protein 6 isoform X1 [Gadus morhua]|uniref:structural maintenance of chromosomes protein 6 isoform X1 n=2 Tax=Gadus morhua TaxID=8049 RepID=UPI0011B6A639|nr:structural maintenance of chromosomes protein 6 isoform X1 [Gadus morhua]